MPHYATMSGRVYRFLGGGPWWGTLKYVPDGAKIVEVPLPNFDGRGRFERGVYEKETVFVWKGDGKNEPDSR